MNEGNLEFTALRAASPDMESRVRDMGFYHTLLDAVDGGGTIEAVGKNTFRKQERHPGIDRIVVKDNALVVDLLLRSS